MLKFIRNGRPFRMNNTSVANEHLDLLRLADEARENRAWPRAANMYERYLENVPTDIPIWTQLGHARKEAGYLVAAVEAYRVGLALKPSDHELRAHLEALADRLTKTVRIGHDLSASAASAEAEQTRSPGEDPTVFASSDMDAIALQQPADDARDQGDWQRAAQLYQDFLRSFPFNGGVWVQYGHALRELGDLNSAETAYRRAIEISATDADAHLQLGIVLCRLQRTEEAFLALATASSLDPQSSATDELDRLIFEQDALGQGHIATPTSDAGGIILKRLHGLMASRRH